MSRRFFPQLTPAAAILVALLWSNAAVAAGPGVHGRVLGHDEQGKYLGVVAGAKIEFQRPGGSKLAETTADKNGYYKVDLPAGDYLYQIEAAGYRKEDAGRGMKLTQSEGYAIFNLAVTKGEDDPNRQPVTGKVVWITPAGTPGRQQGIGVQLPKDEAGAQLRDRIETLLRDAGGDYAVRLKGGAQLSVSRGRIEALEEWMGVGKSRAEE